MVYLQARQELKERAAQNVKDMRSAMGLPALEDGGELEFVMYEVYNVLTRSR